MKKFKFIIQFVDVSNGSWWEEEHECRAWTYDKAVKKALWRAQVVLRGLNNSNKSIFCRVCRYRKV